MRPNDFSPSKFSALWLALAIAAVVPLANSAQPAPVSPPAPASSQASLTVFARVGDITITHDEYNAAFQTATRGKFYHGKPPDAEVAVLQREVSDNLVKRIVVLDEAKRKGLRPDAAAIQKQVQTYEERYAKSEQWKNTRSTVLPPLIARLEEEDLLSQVEKSVRDRAKPTEAQVRAYFTAHPDKFTEPEQMRVSVILLRVDPSANGAVWKAAEDQAKALADRARTGQDFSALARRYSAEASAANGGDMGYLHSGMLPDGSQAVLSKMKVGEISDPQRLLEGMSVFRLTDRKLAKKHKFETVKTRAGELAQRQQADDAWQTFIKDLKGKTTVKIDQSRFLPLAK